jgi:predicted nucleic-acid-binding protein
MSGSNVNSVDANVVLRFVLEDDPEQSLKARRIMEAGDVFVQTGVLLETFWTLRSRYRVPRAEALDVVESVISLDGLRLQEPGIVGRALELAKTGMEFGDALHVSTAAECSTFITFDRALVKKARNLSSPKVRAP